MRIIIDVQQAPGTSYYHLADRNAVEDTIRENLCLDEDAVIEVQVFIGPDENVEVAWA